MWHLQAERWGAQLFTEDVEEVDFRTRPFTIRSTERTVCIPDRTLLGIYVTCNFNDVPSHTFALLPLTVLAFADQLRVGPVMGAVCIARLQHREGLWQAVCSPAYSSVLCSIAEGLASLAWGSAKMVSKQVAELACQRTACGTACSAHVQAGLRKLVKAHTSGHIGTRHRRAALIHILNMGL